MPSPSLSPEDELAFTANNGSFIPTSIVILLYIFFSNSIQILGSSSGKQMNELSQVNVKDGTHSNKGSQQRKVIKLFLGLTFLFIFICTLSEHIKCK